MPKKKTNRKKFMTKEPIIRIYGERKDPWKKRDGQHGSFKVRFNRCFTKDAKVYVPGGWAKEIFFLVQKTKRRGLFKELYAENGELHILVETDSLYVYEECEKTKKKCSRMCQICSSRKDTTLLQWRDKVLRVCPTCHEKKEKTKNKVVRKPEDRVPRPTPIKVAISIGENERIFEYHTKTRRTFKLISEHMVQCLKKKNKEAAQFLFDLGLKHPRANHYRQHLLAVSLLLGGFDNILRAIQIQHEEPAVNYWDVYNEIKLIHRDLAGAMLEKMKFPPKTKKEIYPHLAKDVGWERLIKARGKEKDFPVDIVPKKFKKLALGQKNNFS